jgi:lipopolysaccharide biosynthesis glycosyltransferase
MLAGLLPSRRIRRWAKEWFFVPRLRRGRESPAGNAGRGTGRVAVALCFDTNIERQAMTTMTSLLANRGGAHYDIYCVTDSKLLSEYKRLARALDPESAVMFLAPTHDFDNPKYGWPPSVYYRLMLPKLLPDINRIVYADIDGVFVGDLAGAAALDLAGNPIAGCMDNKTGYINSGFLIMDLARMRAEKSYDDFTYLSKFDFKYPDQDIINIVFKNRIAYLPWGYNFRPVDAKDMIKSRLQSYSDWRELKRNPVYVHFHWQPKPWNGRRVMGWLWRKYDAAARNALDRESQ